MNDVWLFDHSSNDGLDVWSLDSDKDRVLTWIYWANLCCLELYRWRIRLRIDQIRPMGPNQFEVSLWILGTQGAHWFGSLGVLGLVPYHPTWNKHFSLMKINGWKMMEVDSISIWDFGIFLEAFAVSVSFRECNYKMLPAMLWPCPYRGCLGGCVRLANLERRTPSIFGNAKYSQKTEVEPEHDPVKKKGDYVYIYIWIWCW